MKDTIMGVKILNLKLANQLHFEMSELNMMLISISYIEMIIIYIVKYTIYQCKNEKDMCIVFIYCKSIFCEY